MRKSFDFGDVLTGLRKGDFSRLSPVFDESHGESPIIEWHRAERFAGFDAELNEALTCAAFLGRPKTLNYLLSVGLSAGGGNLTGMSALHWAANRGELETFRILLGAGAPLEEKNMYGGTVLGQTVWSAVNQPRAGQKQVIRELIAAGAEVSEVDLPTGNAEIDALFK